MRKKKKETTTTTTTPPTTTRYAVTPLPVTPLLGLLTTLVLL